MSQALAERSVLAPLKPGVGTALAFMGGLAVVGGIGGAALMLSQAQAGRISPSRGWLYGGVGAGVAIGGTIGYLGGRYIVARTIAKLEAAEAAKEEAAS
jgi:hypothetical protein